MEKRKKRPYVKPEVKRVRLDAEVLLVTGCKSSGGANKSGRGCTTTSPCKNNAAGS